MKMKLKRVEVWHDFQLIRQKIKYITTFVSKTKEVIYIFDDEWNEWSDELDEFNISLIL